MKLWQSHVWEISDTCGRQQFAIKSRPDEFRMLLVVTCNFLCSKAHSSTSQKTVMCEIWIVVWYSVEMISASDRGRCIMCVESRALRRCSERSAGTETSRNINTKVRETNVRRAGLQLHDVGRKIQGGGRRHFGKVSVDWSLTDFRGAACDCVHCIV